MWPSASCLVGLSHTKGIRTKEAEVTVTVPDNPAKPCQPDPGNQAVIGAVRWLVTVILLAEQ